MKRKGFTLIELLAVILILGIIALIAIPVVNNIIKEAKRGAFQTTATNITDAVESACSLQQLQDQSITNTYSIVDGVITPSINVKGKLPKSGTIIVNNDCNVSFNNLTDGNFTASKDANSDDITVVDGEITIAPVYTKYDNGTVIYFNPVTGTTCNSGDAVSTTGTKTGCMKWYAFNDSTSNDSVKLLLDHNTTAVVAWNSAATNTAIGEVQATLTSDTSTWLSTLNARLIAANEIADITNNIGWDSTDAGSDSFYFDSNTSTESATCKLGDTTGCNFGWLYSMTSTSCADYGCASNADGLMTGNGYWTSSKSASNSISAWHVNYEGGIFVYDVDLSTYYGVRPIINVLKTSL